MSGLFDYFRDRDSNRKEKAEFSNLVDVLQSRGFQRLGIIFYSPELKLLGIAQLEATPDAFIEEIGKRLGKLVPVGEVARK